MFELFEAVKDTVMELPVYLGAMLGLRRSEVLGLKWSSVDLEKEELRIEEVVVRVTNIHVKAPKSEASARALSIPGTLVEAFKRQKIQQDHYQSYLGPAYQISRATPHLCIFVSSERCAYQRYIRSFRTLV